MSSPKPNDEETTQFVFKPRPPAPPAYGPPPGDPPPSAAPVPPPHPRRRRWPRVLAWLAALLVIAVASLAILLHTPFFWREVILPNALGLNYERVLTIRDINASLFPPTLEVSGVEMRDTLPDAAPNDRVLRLDHAHVVISWVSRPDRIVIKQLEVDGLHIAMRRDTATTINLVKAIEDFKRNRAESIPPPHTATPRALPVIEVRRARLDNIRYHFREDSFGIDFDYQTSEPLRLTSRRDLDIGVVEPGADPGNVAGFLRIFTRGTMSVRAPGVEFAHEARGYFDITNLGRFPNTFVEPRITLRNAERIVAEARARIPLDRVPDAPKSVPFQELRLALLKADGTPAIEIRDTNFDPLIGKLDIRVLTTDEPRVIADAALAALNPGRRDELAVQVSDALQRSGIVRANSRLRTDIHVIGNGIAPYAATDPARIPPLLLETKSSIELTNIPLGALGGGRRGERHLPARLRLDADFQANRSTELGNLRWQLTALRDDSDTTVPIFAILFAQEADQSLGVDLRPFNSDALRAALAPLGERPVEPPPGVISPGYDRLLSTVTRFVRAGSSLLKALGIEGASLRFRMDLNDADLVQDIIAPVFGELQDPGTTFLDIGVFFRGRGRPNELVAALTMRDVRFPGFGRPLEFGARGTFVQDEQNITAKELSTGVRILDPTGPRPAPGTPFDLELGLAREGPDGTFGPLPPTYLNLVTREAHFELQLETINRELVDVFLRLQTFNISQTLAEPLYRRILDLLNMNPERPGGVSARARMYVSGDLGRVFALNSIIRILDLSPGAFLRLPGDSNSPAHQRVDVRWAQRFSLDRHARRIGAEGFDLEILSKELQPIASLRLVSDGPVVLDVDRLNEGARAELDRLAASEGPACGIRDLATEVMRNIRHTRDAVVGRGGSLVFDAPDTDLAVWAETFQQAGIPIRGGTVATRLAASLADDRDSTATVRLSGEFTARDIRFGNAAAPLPELRGNLALAQTSDTLALERLDTAARLDAATPAVRISISGSANAAAGEGETTIRLDGINRSVIERLAEVRASGIGGATKILEKLPIAALRDAAGDSGSVSFEARARTFENGRRSTLEARQTATSLRVLPDYLAPLDFDLRQSVELTSSGTLRLNALDGAVTEQGVAAPLFEVALSHPVELSEAPLPGAPDAEFRFGGRKRIAEMGRRLRTTPLPIVERPLIGGDVAYDVRVVIPGGRIAPDLADLEARNIIRADLTDLRLGGFDRPLSFRLAAETEKTSSTITLRDWRFATAVGTDNGGTIGLEGTLDIATQAYRGRVELLDWSARLLEVLPERHARWVRGQTAQFNMRAAASGRVGGNHATDVKIRLRNFQVPPLSLPGSAEPWRQKPLSADIDLALAADQQTTTVLLSAFRAEARAGTAATSDRFAPIERTLDGIASVILRRPATLGAGPDAVLPAGTETTATLDLAVGPFEARDLAPLLVAHAGVPLVGGTIRADGVIDFASPRGAPAVDLALDAALAKGRWQSQDGTARDLDASTTLRASYADLVATLGQLRIRLDHPGTPGPGDELVVSGAADARATPRRVRVDINSPGLTADRLLALAGDLRQPATSKPAATTPAATPPALSVPRDIVGEMNLRADAFRFRTLVFPRTRARAHLADGIVTLEDFRTDAGDGTVALAARADLATSTPIYAANLSIERLDIAPFLTAFAPTLADRLTGRVDGRMNLRGKGLAPEDMARHLVVDAEAAVREGNYSGLPLQWLLGDLGRIDVQGRVHLSDDRLLFDVRTPRDPHKDVRVRGVVRNAIPRTGLRPWVSAIADAALASPSPRPVPGAPAAPVARTRGPGATVAIVGPVDQTARPAINVRSVEF